ncbi:MAG: GtrA family protein [Chloroflexota bacterium]|nr:GtrA family protein [Chloroflexota bacterium]
MISENNERHTTFEAFQQKAFSAAASRKEQKRFVKFAIVGAIGALVDFAVLNLLVQGIGLTPLWANPFSVSAAIVSNFTWNRLWSFPESRQRPLFSQFGQFAAINVLGLLLNQAIMWATLHFVTPLIGIDAPLDYNLAKAAAIGIVLFWNFGINRVTTYRGL